MLTDTHLGMCSGRYICTVLAKIKIAQQFVVKLLSNKM